MTPLRALGAALLASLALSPAAAADRRPSTGFPAGFLWGTAISGFQTEMGRGRNLDTRSDWWVWTHDASNRSRGIVTDDLPEDGPGHWALFRRDLDLARRSLNNNAFRLSVEWSRIFPRPTTGVEVGRRIDRHDLARLDGLANHRAVRHYRAVLRAARRRGIEPFVTLHHWTIPTWLHDAPAVRDALAARGPDDPLPRIFRDGWLDRTTVQEFRKYAAYLGWKLGDLADFWSPINEPMVLVASGYVNVPGVLAGNFPPGAFSFTGAIRVVLNLERGNTVAYRALKRWDRHDADRDGRRARVGPVQNTIAFTPAEPSSSADRRAADHAHYLFNRLFLNAAVRGDIDRDADGRLEPGERRRHGRNADFVGLNYYFRSRVSAAGAPLSSRVPILDFIPSNDYRTPLRPSLPPCPTVCSEFGNEIYPRGFRRLLRTAASYGLPVYVTENGVADRDDNLRPGHLVRHLRQLRRALVEDHLDIRGYFHWSLTDNFEWSAGYFPRFGLFRYDVRTLARRARRSARIYSRIARLNGIPRDLARRYP